MGVQAEVRITGHVITEIQALNQPTGKWFAWYDDMMRWSKGPILHRGPKGHEELGTRSAGRRREDNKEHGPS